MRLWVVRRGLEDAGHICVPLNIGINRKIRSSEYECVRNGWEYLSKLIRYSRRGYVVHKHTNGDSLKGFILDLIAYGASFLAGRRPVLTVHAGTDQIYFPRHKSRLMIPFFTFLFHAAKVVICDNPDVARCIVEYGISKEKVFAISPFTKQYLEVPEQALEPYAREFIKSRSPVILTYLECRDEYDIDSLFWVISELAESAPRAGLLITGASRDRRTISELLNASQIADRSLHLGAVEHGQFLALLRNVSLYLRCNEREGTSASIREALYFDVPVVANDAESQPEGVITYPWGNRHRMLEQVRNVLARLPASESAHPRENRICVPDTVAEEVGVLVRCALGECSGI
jgi:glycosyltransferase involved in cell wall biosynthesis